MDRLPPELVTHILDFIVQDPVSPTVDPLDLFADDDADDPRLLSKLSTVSAQWHDTVETKTFRDISLSSEDWPLFVDYISKYGRWRKLHTLGVSISREALEGEDTFSETFSESDMVALDRYWRDLTLIVKRIWDQLHSWGDDSHLSSLRLVFPQHPVIYRANVETAFQSGLAYTNPFKHYEQGYVVPELKSVATLCIFAKGARVCPGYLWDLAGSCASLRRWTLETDEHEKGNERAVLNARIDLVRETIRAAPRNLKQADLLFDYTINLNQSKDPLTLTHAGADIFSRCIRNLSLGLTKLRLRASQLSAELFWPQDNDAVGRPPPHWPHLRDVDITTTIECATGYYMLLPADKSRPHREMYSELDGLGDALDEVRDIPAYATGQWPFHMVRIRPDHNLFGALSVGIARAAKRMPGLERLLYRTDQLLSGHDSALNDFSFSFYVAEEEEEDGRDGEQKHHDRIDWIFGCTRAQLLDWRMPDEATRAWKDRCGESLEIGIITNESIDDRTYKWLRTADSQEQEEANFAEFFSINHRMDWW